MKKQQKQRENNIVAFIALIGFITMIVLIFSYNRCYTQSIIYLDSIKGNITPLDTVIRYEADTFRCVMLISEVSKNDYTLTFSYNGYLAYNGYDYIFLNKNCKEINREKFIIWNYLIK